MQGADAVVLGQDLVHLNPAVFPEVKARVQPRKSSGGRMKGRCSSMEVGVTRTGSRVGVLGSV